MEVIFVGLLSILIIVLYLSSLEKPTLLKALLFSGSMLAMAAILYGSGIEIPGKGYDLSDPTQIIVTKDTYNVTNNILVFGVGFFCLIYGFWGLVRIWNAMDEKRVMPDGTIR